MSVNGDVAEERPENVPPGQVRSNFEMTGRISRIVTSTAPNRIGSASSPEGGKMRRKETSSTRLLKRSKRRALRKEKKKEREAARLESVTRGERIGRKLERRIASILARGVAHLSARLCCAPMKRADAARRASPRTRSRAPVLSSGRCDQLRAAHEANEMLVLQRSLL